MFPITRVARAVVKPDHSRGFQRSHPCAAIIPHDVTRLCHSISVVPGQGTRGRRYGTMITSRECSYPTIFSNEVSRRSLPILARRSDPNVFRQYLSTTGEHDADNTTTTEESSREITIPGAETGGRKLAIIFTCTHCGTRSMKQFSEKAYTQGVVIATCPGCQKKHLIADNLGYFTDNDEDGSVGWNIQKGMERLGENVKVATNDSVLELSLEDIFTAEAIEEAVNQASGDQILPKKDDTNESKIT